MPMNWPEIRISSWPDFVARIDRIAMNSPFSDQDMFFRGQADSAWRLTPPLVRMFKERLDCPSGSDRSADAIRLERSAHIEFCRQAHLHVDPRMTTHLKTVVCWWALMQHHGAPTRLLDWTTSPYVAAYFAARDQPSRDATVWAFCSGALQQELDVAGIAVPNTSDPDLSREAIRDFEARVCDPAAERLLFPLRFPKCLSERMPAQQGCFTMCQQVMSGHECMISQIGEKHLWRFTISAELKPVFIHRLRSMNITASTLFPGVDGLAQSVAELLTLGMYSPTANEQGVATN